MDFLLEGYRQIYYCIQTENIPEMRLLYGIGSGCFGPGQQSRSHCHQSPAQGALSSHDWG